MSFEVHYTSNFAKAAKALAKRYRSLKSDLSDFIDSIESNPFQGDELTPGIWKIMMAITSKGRGKSGGARVITYTILITEDSGDVYLLDIYDKSDYSTVDVAVLQKITKSIETDTGHDTE